MITMPALYNPYAAARKCSMNIVFELIDISAAETAVPSATDECIISKLEQTHNRQTEVSKKYATLENDYWMLDGTFLLPDENTIQEEETGWWSDQLSSSTGSFSSPPALEFEWDTNHSSAGFVIYFDGASNEYAKRLRVRAYNSEGRQIKSKIVTAASCICEVDMAVENYRKISIEVLNTSKPFRRARISEVVFGFVKTFDNTNIISSTLDYSLSDTAESLPTSELTLTIDNSDAAWNMGNPKGIYAYLQQTQPLDVSIDIDGHSFSMGRFYFTKASAEDNAMTAKITANDKIYWLDKAKFYGGSDGEWTLEQAINNVIATSEIDMEISLPQALKTRLVRAALPADCTCRSAIQLLAQSACCTCYIARDGKLTFFDTLEYEWCGEELSLDRVMSNPKITVSEEINTVDLTVANPYVEGSDDKHYQTSCRVTGEPIKTESFENCTVNDGNAVSEWLLNILRRRLLYNVEERGNPALLLTDYVQVDDAYENGGFNDVMITRQKFSFDGSLKCELEGRAYSE